MQSVKVYRINKSATLPAKQTQGSGAYDICACIDANIIINKGQRMAIPTGLMMEVPEGHILSVRPRSGLSIRHGITLINSPGTIDSDYRGEVQILLINHGDEVFVVSNGDRIAQVLLEKTVEFSWKETDKDDIGMTERAEGGFGSTGIC